MSNQSHNFFNTQLRVLSKQSLDHINFRWMAPVLASLWFYFTKILFFLIKFIARHAFRIRTDDRTQKQVRDFSVQVELEPEASEVKERDFDGFKVVKELEEEEEEPSSFSFKFEYQMPKNITVSNELPSVYQARTANISNYEFLLKKDFSGFIEDPETMTFQVRESFIDDGEVKLEPNLLPAMEFEEPTIQQLSTVNFLSSQSSEISASDSEPSIHQTEDVIFSQVREKDNIRNFSDFDSHSDSISLTNGASVNDSMPKSEDLVLANDGHSLEERKPVNSGTRPLNEKKDIGEFSACDSDSDSISFTDGVFVNTSILNAEDVVLLNDDHSLEERRPVNSGTKQSSDKKDIENFSCLDSDSDSISLTDVAFVNDSMSKSKNVVLSNDDHSLEDRRPVNSGMKRFSDKNDVRSFSVFDSDSDSISLNDGAFVNDSMPKFKDTALLNDDHISEDRSPVNSGTKPLSENEDIGGFCDFDSDSDSLSLSDDGYSVKNLIVDSQSDGFLSDKENLIDFSTVEAEGAQGTGKLEEGQFSNLTGQFYKISGNTNLESPLDEFQTERGFDDLNKESEDNCSPWTDRLSQLDELWSENDSLQPELQLKELNAGEVVGSSSVQLELMDDSSDDEELDSGNSNSAYTKGVHEELDSGAETTEGYEKRRETDEEKFEEAKNLHDLDGEELDELESLWEHQDLIEQLKMELKRVRAVGLPTIFEESESPRTIEDLKPWKIDEKFLREDPIDELHKFYKEYRERMRKFDILNYQKMYAIGFLQLKNPLESMGAHKPFLPTIFSHLSQNLKPFNRRKSSTDASEKFIRELQIDLETVYVGQTCLSWEFLHWQYEKARELPDSDPYRSHQYNQVAGEFQQFQVILQRFVENESFQGPRLPNYVKSRCVLRNLLQVPVIKEDCLRDKMEEKKKGNGAITSEMLEDIMEESIRIFWEFVKADKDETSTILKGIIGNQVELQDPADSGLMADIHASLLKKDKKLKDILKTGNCLVKKFKKPREDRSNQDLFFSQVDMKLVSRMLKMSRITTEQLVWCHKKLSKITFIDRKIHREPSFVLFPC